MSDTLSLKIKMFFATVLAVFAAGIALCMLSPLVMADDETVSESDSSSEDDTSESADAVPEKGYVFKKGKLKYEVTSSGKTVSCTGKVSKKTVKTLTIPDTVKYGGIKYKVTAVADGAFKNQTSIKSVTIGDNVISIGSRAFMKCTGISSIETGDNVKKIGVGAFCGCSGMSRIAIGKNVKSIGKKAFANCKNVTLISITTKKLTTKNVGSKAFQNTGKRKGSSCRCFVSVPSSKKSAYSSLLKSRGLVSNAMIT